MSISSNQSINNGAERSLFELLPDEIVKNICCNLTLQSSTSSLKKNVNNFRFTSKRFQRIADDNYVWKIIANRFNIPLNNIDVQTTFKEQVKVFIESNTPAPVNRLHNFVMGILDWDFCALPILDLQGRRGATDYIDFVKVSEMTAPIMKGIDCQDRPFIALRWTNRKWNQAQGLEKKYVTTVFQRSRPDSEHWESGGVGSGTGLFRNHVSSEESRDYLTRLIKREPCGGRNSISRIENDERIMLPSGESVVALI